MLRYLVQVENLSNDFIGLIAEAFGISRKDTDVFFDEPARMQHRAKVIFKSNLFVEITALRLALVKVVKYPTLDDVSSDQGVGPHFDSGFLTFVSQIVAPRAPKPTCMCTVAASIFTRWLASTKSFWGMD